MKKHPTSNSQRPTSNEGSGGWGGGNWSGYVCCGGGAAATFGDGGVAATGEAGPPGWKLRLYGRQGWRLPRGSVVCFALAEGGKLFNFAR